MLKDDQAGPRDSRPSPVGHAGRGGAAPHLVGPGDAQCPGGRAQRRCHQPLAAPAAGVGRVAYLTKPFDVAEVLQPDRRGRRRHSGERSREGRGRSRRVARPVHATGSSGADACSRVRRRRGGVPVSIRALRRLARRSRELTATRSTSACSGWIRSATRSARSWPARPSPAARSRRSGSSGWTSPASAGSCSSVPPKTRACRRSSTRSKGTRTLTVGRGADFTRRGGMIGFTANDRRDPVRRESRGGRCRQADVELAAAPGRRPGRPVAHGVDDHGAS